MTLLWLFPQQEHQLVGGSDDAQYFVAVFKPSLIAEFCRPPAYEGLKADGHPQQGVLSTRLGAESYDLMRKTMDSLMQGAVDPDVLNREAGFGVSSDFCFSHGDPDGLNAWLRYLLLLCCRSRHTGSVLGSVVALHPKVRLALRLLSEGGEEDLGRLAEVCGVSSAFLSRTFRRQDEKSLLDASLFRRLRQLRPVLPGVHQGLWPRTARVRCRAMTGEQKPGHLPVRT